MTSPLAARVALELPYRQGDDDRVVARQYEVDSEYAQETGDQLPT